MLTGCQKGAHISDSEFGPCGTVGQGVRRALGINFMLLAMFTWCCASFRSLFAMDIKEPQIRKWLRLLLPFSSTLMHNQSGLGMTS